MSSRYIIALAVLLLFLNACAKKLLRQQVAQQPQTITTPLVVTPEPAPVAPVEEPSLIQCDTIDIASMVRNICGEDYVVSPVTKGDISKGSYTAEFHLGKTACTFSAEQSESNGVTKYGTNIIIGINRYDTAEKARTPINNVVTLSDSNYSRTILEEFEQSDAAGKLFEEGKSPMKQTMFIAQQDTFAIYVQPVTFFERGAPQNPFCSNPEGTKRLAGKTLEYLVGHRAQ